jgi:hypothetical protein
VARPPPLLPENVTALRYVMCRSRAPDDQADCVVLRIKRYKWRSETDCGELAMSIFAAEFEDNYIRHGAGRVIVPNL